MAGRKLKPIEGDVCWFCKQPADAGSWLDLGELKSTHEPVFEGTHYILYHEPCAVYSNGAIVSVTGMDDQAVLQFWLHGERCSGIGLKCQLCGLRGATTGCLHGPCQQFYHYPCARVRAFQGYLQFSPTCRALACDKHLALLPDPGEQEFLGMWMEGAGGWKGLYKEQAAAAWQTRYTAHITDFQKRWHHLLSMVPLEERKAMQQKQKKRRSSKAGMASAEAGDSDPEFRVRKQSRTSHPGAKAKTGQQQQRQRQRQQQTVKQGASSPRALQQRVPQRVGVPPEVAQAALHAAVQQQQAVPNAGAGAAGDRLESGAVGDEKSSELLSLDGANGQQQAEQQYQAAAGPLHRVSSGGHSHAELLLRAAGFTTSPSPTAHQQQDHSHGLLPSHSDAFAPASSSDRPAHAAAAALAAAVMAAAAKNGSSSRTASSVAKAAAAGAAAGLGSGASSADSAPAHKETNRAAVAEAPAGDTDPTADAGQEVISAAVPAMMMPALQASLESPTSACAQKRAEAARSAVASFPVRRTAPYCRQAVEAAAAAARSAAPSGRTAPAAAGDGDGGAGLKDQSDNSMPGFNAGCCREQPGAEAGGAATGAAASSRGGNRRQRRYLDVNTYAAMGQKKLTFEPELDAASQQRRQAAATVGKHQQQQISRLPSSSTTAPAASPSVAAANLLGWPGNRGVDMFSWLQQQVQPQPLASPPPVHTSAGLTDTHLPGGQPPPNANGLTALGLVTQRRAAAIAGGNGGQLTVSTEVLQQAADAVADAATKLRSRLESGDKHKVLADMEGLTWQATAAAARESSTQVPYMAKQSPLTTPRLPLGTSATAAGSSDNNNLVPAVAKLLRVIGAQVGGQQQPPPAGPAGLDSTQQQKSTLKQSRSLDPYMGVEVANAAAAAAAGASCNVLSSSSAAATLGSLAGPFELLPHMAEYFGCVSALPALQPGELRAGGVTAHPKVVSAYVKQDMRKALTLQPWSIVIPPFALRQLRSAQIEPGHLASQLYQLLHASNVLNHHSTNATAAGGGRGAGGGSMGVSGGYAGMPQDFPVRFVQGCMIPGDDPRPELRGEFMLKAMQDIEVGTIIGPWRCYLLAQEDYSRLQRTVPADWQGPDAGVRAQAWLQLLHKYTLSVRVPFLATNDPYGKALASNAPVLHLCALGYGHLTCLVNDAIKDPTSAAAGLETINTAAPNVELCVVLVNGLPLPVLISTRQIKQGQELLCSYGKNYWQTWCSLREETATVSHGGSGQQQHMQHV